MNFLGILTFYEEPLEIRLIGFNFQSICCDTFSVAKPSEFTGGQSFRAPIVEVFCSCLPSARRQSTGGNSVGCVVLGIWRRQRSEHVVRSFPPCLPPPAAVTASKAAPGLKHALSRGGLAIGSRSIDTTCANPLPPDHCSTQPRRVRLKWHSSLYQKNKSRKYLRVFSKRAV